MLIHVPLQMLIDFMGFRLVCMAVLPLKNSQLIYGSEDGGKTVKNENSDFSRAMLLAGAELHLAKHRVKDVVLEALCPLFTSIFVSLFCYLSHVSVSLPLSPPSSLLHSVLLYHLLSTLLFT
jgi:hypothetical protein